jgi:RNA polymerase sigma-70 factor, ECF subfamily
MREAKTASAENPARSLAAASAARSFQELFLEHWSGVYQLLVRMIGDPAEAEDLALETFYRLYKNPPENGEGFNLRGWLFRVATNLGLHSIRSDQRRQRYELEAGKYALEAGSPEYPAEVLENKEANHLVRLVLSRMKPRQAALLILRYSGLEYKEIAGALGLAPTSIGPLLIRAEREFAKKYRSHSREEL